MHASLQCRHRFCPIYVNYKLYFVYKSHLSHFLLPIYTCCKLIHPAKQTFLPAAGQRSVSNSPHSGCPTSNARMCWARKLVARRTISTFVNRHIYYGQYDTSCELQTGCEVWIKANRIQTSWYCLLYKTRWWFWSCRQIKRFNPRPDVSARPSYRNTINLFSLKLSPRQIEEAYISSYLSQRFHITI